MLRRGSSAGRERGWYHRVETLPSAMRLQTPPNCIMDRRWTRRLPTPCSAIAEDARARIRREDPESAAMIEARYPELLEALDWYLDAGQPDEAFRLATALVPFWMSTKRIDDGDRWFARALAQPAGSAPRRARATYDHGYLVFWAGRYDLADERFADARAQAEGVGDSNLVALALAGAARVALGRDPAEAARLCREALAATETMPASDGRLERPPRPRRRAPDGGRPRGRSRRHDTPARARARER